MRIVGRSGILALALGVAALGGAYRGKPYGGKAQKIPGRIEMELYDTGGPGIAYNDTDADNNGSGKLNKGDTPVEQFRKDEGVDLSYTKPNIDRTVDGAQEKTGELYLGWTAPGEWVAYTVEVQASGTYAVHAHMTSRTDDAQITLAVDSTQATRPIRLPTTTHWHIWRVAKNLAQVKLEKGVHVLSLHVEKEGNFNIDYLEFEPVETAPKTVAFPYVGTDDQVKKMTRGINIIGYDPLWKDPDKARFNDTHFRRVREGGFNSVRVNLHAFAHMDDANRLSDRWFRTVDWVVKSAVANDLTVILDEHNFTDCGRDAAWCKPKLMAFWEQVADRYKDAPASVVFEILNEPNGAITPAMWNDWLREALEIIRKTNPTRNVVIGPANWNGIHGLEQLQLPAEDRHIIATVHYYLPMTFTHQGAPWAKEAAKLSGITWGTEEDKRKVDADFAGVQAWAQRERRPMLLGEFGAYEKAEMESRARYTSYLARAAESLGWCWTYWQFDSDFIAWDMAKDDWVGPIHSALVPPAR